MPKQKMHNEWFRSVYLGGRKSCPRCGAKHDPLGTDHLWSWGEYHHARWYTIMHFCKACFATEVIPTLHAHVATCGCTLALQVQGVRPEWLTLPHDNPTP